MNNLLDDSEPGGAGEGGKDGEGGAEAGGPVEPETTPDAVMECNFCVTAFEVLKILTEVLSPASVGKLRVMLKKDSNYTKEELVGLIEYTETELIYVEFLRLLLRMAETKTRYHTKLCEKLELDQRLFGFLRHVFLPALATPYAPPTAEDEEGEEERKKSKEEEGAEKPAAEGG